MVKILKQAFGYYEINNKGVGIKIREKGGNLENFLKNNNRRGGQLFGTRE